MARKRDPNDNNGERIEEMINEVPKFITLNQVNVKIAGGTDKLLVVRDVTSIVMNEKIVQTKREMSRITDILMKEIEDHSGVIEMKLQKLFDFVTGQGRPLNDQSQMYLKKLQFRVKDFQQLYNI